MRYTGEYSVFKDRQRIRVVNLIKSYITNGEADTSRRKGKSAYDSIQTEQLKKDIENSHAPGAKDAIINGYLSLLNKDG